MDSLSFYFNFPGDSKDEAQKSQSKSLLQQYSLVKDAYVLVPQTLQKFHPTFDPIIGKLIEMNVTVAIIYNKEKPIWKNK